MPYNLEVPAYRQYISHSARREYKEIVDEILASGMLAEGKYVELVEKVLKKISGKDYVVLTSNGGSAFDVLLAYYRNVEKKKRAYVQAVGFHGTVQYLKRNGYDIVFVDTEKDRFIIDVDKLRYDEDGIVVTTELFGYFYPDVNEKLKDIGMPVVHDAAQTLGVMDTEDDYFTSFHGGKIVGVGEGGAIFTDNEKLNVFARRYKKYGMVGRRPHLEGYNHAITEICAGLLYVLLKDLDYVMSVCRSNVIKYADNLEMMYENVLRYGGYEYKHNGLMAVLMTKNFIETQALRMTLYEEYGIEPWGTAGRYMPFEPIVEGKNRVMLSNAFSLSNRHVLLPNGVVNKDRIDYVIRAVKSAYEMFEGRFDMDVELWKEWRG